jgi:hypothetical protein
MKHIVIFSLILVFFSCKESKKTKDYNFKEIGWTISVPLDFSILTSAESGQIRKAATQAVKEAYDSTYYDNTAKTLLSFKKDETNYFSAGIVPFHEPQDGEWFQSNRNKKELILDTYKSQNPEAKIDTSSTLELIDGLTFECFEVKMAFPDKLILTSRIYSRLINGFNFTISMAFIDETIGKELKSISLSSKFEK